MAARASTITVLRHHQTLDCEGGTSTANAAKTVVSTPDISSHLRPRYIAPPPRSEARRLYVSRRRFAEGTFGIYIFNSRIARPPERAVQSAYRGFPMMRRCVQWQTTSTAIKG